jgi:recombination protein RecT
MEPDDFAGRDGGMTMADVLHKSADLQKRAEGLRAELEKAAATGIDVDRLIATWRSAIMGSEILRKCSPESLLRSLSTSAQCGLEIGINGEAYIVPFFRKGSGWQGQFIPGWRGLVKLAYQGGLVRSIGAHIVREGDDFAYWVDEHGEHVRHNPDLFGAPDRPLRGAYAIATLTTGGTAIEAMPMHEILAIKGRSAAVKAGASTPWDTDEGEMIRKTVIRRLVKRLALSSDVARRLQIAEDSAMVIEGVVDDAPRRKAPPAPFAKQAEAIVAAAGEHPSPAVFADPAPAAIEAPEVSALLALVDLDIEERSALVECDPEHVGRWVDTIAELPQEQRAEAVRVQVLGWEQ